MQLYSRETIDDLQWPPGHDGVRPVLEALVRHGPLPFIANIAAEVLALHVEDLVLPVVRVDREPPLPNAYVCSPTTHYVDYARREAELELGEQALLRAVLPPVLEALRALLRWSQAERAVYVNNWLLSTNLYPPFTEGTRGQRPALDTHSLAAIHAGVLHAFPDHAVIYRSLNEALNGSLIAALERLGYERVFSRQVYLLDPRDGGFRRRNNYGHDRRLARRSSYRWLPAEAIPTGAAGRLCDLYRDLYIAKYSRHNPQLTPHFIAEALRGRWLTVAALADGARLDGVLGFIEQHDVLTAPLVGYDRSRPAESGLYRLLMLELVEQAAARGRVLHLSSGAASFKRLRGAEPQIEYSLVFHHHLAPRRRAPWRLLAWLSGRAIIPLMERYGL